MTKTFPIFPTEILNGMTEEEKAVQQTPLCKTPVSDMLQFAAQLLPSIDHAERRPASADSFFHQPLYHGHPGYTGAQLDDPAVLTDSTQFYANYNANYQPVCLDNQWWYHNMYASGQYTGAASSMQNLAGAAGWIDTRRPETSRVTVAERFINTVLPPPGISAQGANDVDSERQEQVPSPSLEMAKAMLKELQVPTSKTSAVYADEKESQSQAAEVIPVGAGNVKEEPVSPSCVKSESATEALMRALRACSPDAKVSAAASMQPARKVKSENQDVNVMMKEQSSDTGSQREPKEEFLLTASETTEPMLCSPSKTPKDAEMVKPVDSPRRSLSDSSSPGGSPVKQGTPRKVRIAARFDVPIEATSDESS